MQTKQNEERTNPKSSFSSQQHIPWGRNGKGFKMNKGKERRGLVQRPCIISNSLTYHMLDPCIAFPRFPYIPCFTSLQHCNQQTRQRKKCIKDDLVTETVQLLIIIKQSIPIKAVSRHMCTQKLILRGVHNYTIAKQQKCCPQLKNGFYQKKLFFLIFEKSLVNL